MPLTREQVLSVHKETYVNAVQSGIPLHLAESQGFEWDQGIWSMALASNGGAVAAALTALKEGVSGSLSSGLHHAGFANGVGFCTFNGLVLSAKAAIDAGAKSVLILDLDAHCGGGTASLIAGEARIRQCDISVDNFDRYLSSEQSTLEIIRSADNYLPTIRQALQEAIHRWGHFDLCIYNAGMDPSELCSTGGLNGITKDILAERERLVFQWCKIHKILIAFVMAGGYIGSRLDINGLVDLHRLTVAEARNIIIN